MAQTYIPITKDTSIALINGSTNTKVKVAMVTVDTSTSSNPTYKSNINTNDITITKEGDGYMGGQIKITTSQDTTDNKYLDVSITIPSSANSACNGKTVSAQLYTKDKSKQFKYKLNITNTSTNVTSEESDDYAKVMVNAGTAYTQTLYAYNEGYAYGTLDYNTKEYLGTSNIKLPSGSIASYVIIVRGYLYFASKGVFGQYSDITSYSDKIGFYQGGGDNTSVFNVGTTGQAKYDSYNSTTKQFDVSIYNYASGYKSTYKCTITYHKN